MNPPDVTDLLGRKRGFKDRDISALNGCIRSLNKSTSQKMLRANIGFLYDYYLAHPSKDLPDHLRPNDQAH